MMRKFIRWSNVPELQPYKGSTSRMPDWLITDCTVLRFSGHLETIRLFLVHAKWWLLGSGFQELTVLAEMLFTCNWVVHRSQRMISQNVIRHTLSSAACRFHNEGNEHLIHQQPTGLSNYFVSPGTFAIFTTSWLNSASTICVSIAETAMWADRG